MRILIVMVKYFPAVNPNVYRWSAIAEHWHTEGHEIHILTSHRSGLRKNESINGVKVHRTGHATLMDWVSNLSHKKERRDEDGNNSRKQGKLRQVLEKIVDITWRELYWPDGSSIWMFPARKRLQALSKQYDFDSVISVGLPFTTHMVASNLKKRNSNISWLMDIEDPFCYSEEFYVNNFSLYKKLNIKTEHKLMHRADSISVTIEEAKNKYLALFPSLKNKIKITPPLSTLTTPLKKYKEKEEIDLAYFGTFYKNVRKPQLLIPLLKSLSTQHKIRLHFYGFIPAFCFESMEEIRSICQLHLHGLVSRDVLPLKISESDYLINIGNSTDYHLPSKVVDYLESGMPIINICQLPNDTTKLFFSGYDWIFNWEMNSIIEKSALLEFIHKTKGQQVEKTIREEKITPFRIETIASKYLKLLK